jgi:hypothetical protein
MVALTGEVCAADAIARKRTASSTAGAFNVDYLIADCMMDISV